MPIVIIMCWCGGKILFLIIVYLPYIIDIKLSGPSDVEINIRLKATNVEQKRINIVYESIIYSCIAYTQYMAHRILSKRMRYTSYEPSQRPWFIFQSSFSLRAGAAVCFAEHYNSEMRMNAVDEIHFKHQFSNKDLNMICIERVCSGGIHVPWRMKRQRRNLKNETRY